MFDLCLSIARQLHHRNRRHSLNTQTSSSVAVRLPSFITAENKWVVFAVTAFISCLMYVISNYYPLREPARLSLTVIDARTPLLPWSVWIYLSEYFLFIFAVVLCRDCKVLNRFFYSFVFLQVFAVVLFSVYPTTFPREAFPVWDGAKTLSEQALLYLRRVDAPNNCFPSLHVASCLLFSMMFFRREPGKFWFFAGWTFLVSLSTLTTKQHYLADVFAGVAAALLSYVIFFVILSDRDPELL